MKNLFSFAAIVAAMFTLFACGGGSGNNGDNVVSPADPSVIGKLKDYIQVVKVTPLSLTCDESTKYDLVTNAESISNFYYAGGTITVKCNKEIPEGEPLVGCVILLDANGAPIYDGKIKGVPFTEAYVRFSREDIKPGEEKTINYKLCLQEAHDETKGLITGEYTTSRIIGPVKFVQIAGE